MSGIAKVDFPTVGESKISGHKLKERGGRFKGT